MPRQVWRWQVGRPGSDFDVIGRDRLPPMTLRNLITDIPGLRVGHAGDGKLASGTTVVVFDAPVVGERRRARRRARHARDRAARSGADGGRHRRDRSVRRLGLRARCRLRRAGLYARAGPRLQDSRRRGADRAGGDHVRPAQRRRQELGPLSALSRVRLRRRQDRQRRIRARQRRRGARRDHRDAQGRRRLGLGANARRRHRRRPGGGQCRRHNDHRRRSAFLGGAVRAEQGIRRARLAGGVVRERSRDPRQRRARREHDASR